MFDHTAQIFSIIRYIQALKTSFVISLILTFFAFVLYSKYIKGLNVQTLKIGIEDIDSNKIEMLSQEQYDKKINIFFTELNSKYVN